MVSIQILLIGFLALSISAIITRSLMPWVIRSSLRSGITTIDAHKPDKPRIAEPGGLASLISFIFTILIIIFIWELTNPNTQDFETLLAGLLSIVIAGLIGFLDDVFKIRWRDKILLGFLPAIPLMALKVGKSNIDLGILGVLDLGHLIELPIIGYINLYSLVIIPLAINFAFNSFNMLAGFNGLEAGNGVISLSIILLLSLFIDTSGIITLFVTSLLGGSLILLKYNWYPAKILIGDTGTLTLGTGIITALIIGNMDRLAIGLFGIHFINFMLFLLYLYTHQTVKIASVDQDGYILAPCPYTVYWFIPYFRRVTEKQNVLIILLIHTLIAIIVLLFSIPFFSGI
ncbi:hypothetical protein [Candidatus Hodarchaeum mangrovi]